MEYSKIISVTGLGGLFEVVGSKKDGAIVRSLDDKTVKFVSSRVHNFSHIEGIEIFTLRDNVNLVEIFKAMDGSTEQLPSNKDAAAVKAYFAKVYPDMDFVRVYSSDLKKMLKWHTILKNHNVEIKLSAQEEQTAAQIEEAVVEESPAKVAKTTKKSAAKEETASVESAAPVKKAAGKKAVKEEASTEEAAPAPKKTTKKKTDSKL